MAFYVWLSVRMYVGVRAYVCVFVFVYASWLRLQCGRTGRCCQDCDGTATARRAIGMQFVMEVKSPLVS